MNRTNIIQTQHLTKSYGDFTAVSDLNLHIRRGSVYGFLGPNGAGKSTTMKMFLGLTRPTGGIFQIDGKSYPRDRVAILREIGSFIEAPAFYGNLTGEENLDLIRRILGLPRSSVEEALELVGLSQFRKRLARKYSLGMKQRLGLAGALIGRPPILILDEPTNGLDPVGIHEIRTLIRSLPKRYDCHRPRLLSSAAGGGTDGRRYRHPQPRSPSLRGHDRGAEAESALIGSAGGQSGGDISGHDRRRQQKPDGRR